MLMGRVRGVLGDWLPALTLMALIFWLSSQSMLPSPPDKAADFALKKFAHVMAYGALSLFYLRAVRWARRPFLVAFLLTVVYAASDEIHQSTVPERGANLRDVMIDAAAAGGMLLSTRLLVATRRRRLRTAVQKVTGLRDGQG